VANSQELTSMAENCDEFAIYDDAVSDGYFIVVVDEVLSALKEYLLAHADEIEGGDVEFQELEPVYYWFIVSESY